MASPAEPCRSGHVEEYGSLDLLPLLCTPAGISRREAEAVPECPRLAPGESVIEYKSPLNVLKDTYDYSCY